MKRIIAVLLVALFVTASFPFSAVAVGDEGVIQSGIATPDEAKISNLFGYENNLAYGKDYVISGDGKGYDPYTADLTDGVASNSIAIFNDNWFGFCIPTCTPSQNTVDGKGTVTVDLGSKYDIENIMVHFASINQAAVFSPSDIELYYSIDGNGYTLLESEKNNRPDNNVLPNFYDSEYDNLDYWVNFDVVNTEVRYVRIVMTLASSFAFLNEIVINEATEAPSWTGEIADSFASGSGSEADPYIITTAEELAYMAEIINSDTEGEYKHVHFELGNDIYLNDISVENWASNAKQWTPIGTKTNPFYGHFNGNEYTIHGLYINSDADNLGLFGHIETTSAGLSPVVYNLAIENSYVKGRNNVGAVAGYLNDSNRIYFDSDIVTFDNCYSSAVVEGDFNVGGIAGMVINSYLYSCANAGVVSGVCGVGGIVGYGYGVDDYTYIEECYNIGEIYGGDKAGGIAGSQTYGRVTNSGNIGAINANTQAGGIIGFSNSTNIDAAVNMADINGCYFIGGIAGNFNYEVAYECINLGNITAIDHVGGFAGKTYGGSLEYGANLGNITGNFYIGGFTGEAMGWSRIYDYENLGNISGNEYVAGIAGRIEVIDIEYCHNGGAVYARDQLAGGIAGASYYSVIKNSFNSGYISGGNYGGGLTANPHYDNIINCYNSGIVEGSSYFGALIGVYDELYESPVTDCYYLEGTAEIGCAGGWDQLAGIRYEYEDQLDDITVLTDEEMQDGDYFEGFDFGEIWTFDTSETSEYFYPMLIGGHRHGYYEQNLDENSHWYECVCGDKIGYESHTAGVWEDHADNCANRYCTLCGKHMDSIDLPNKDKLISEGADYTVSGGSGYEQYTANLTDGQYTDDVETYDNQWFAFYYQSDFGEDGNTVNKVGTVTMDLGELHKLESIAVHLGNISASAVNPPEWIKVYTSADGENYEYAGEIEPCYLDSIGMNDNIAYWTYLNLENLEARYVKLEFKVHLFFVFLNEIQVYGESLAETGDVNNNGSIDMTDYILTKRAYFGTYTLSKDEFRRADVNSNGEIDMTDYVLVKRAYFGTYTF